MITFLRWINCKDIIQYEVHVHSRGCTLGRKAMKSTLAHSLCITYSFACSTLLVLLVRPAALIHSLASSFTRYRDHGKLNWIRWFHKRSTRSGLGPQQNKSHAVGRGQWCKNRPENANKNNCERAWHFTCRSLSKVISLEKESSR